MNIIIFFIFAYLAIHWYENVILYVHNKNAFSLWFSVSYHF